MTDLSHTDADGDRTDEESASRITLSAGGRVEVALDYTDDDGNPAGQATATHVTRNPL